MQSTSDVEAIHAQGHMLSNVIGSACQVTDFLFLLSRKVLLLGM